VLLSHWVLPLFAVASAPFETCLLEIISARKLVDVFDFDGVFVIPLPAARLWPAGHSLLVCFPSLLEFLRLFPFLSCAALMIVAGSHGVALCSSWRKSRVLEELCQHHCSSGCRSHLVFVFRERATSRSQLVFKGPVWSGPSIDAPADTCQFD
jgi:hypothetical protein